LDSNLHSPERRLIELRIEHADLDALIDRLALESPVDELMIRRLKKRRLACVTRSPADAVARPQRACLMPLQDMVREAFAPGGVLVACGRPNFRPRSGQTDMALAVARVIQQGGALVVEAGTGVGKTFRVPGARLAQRRAGTAVHRHQDAAGPAVRTRPAPPGAGAGPAGAHGLAQGRGSYLCLHRMELGAPGRRHAARPGGGTHARQGGGMGPGHPHRRPGRIAGAGRAVARHSAGHLDRDNCLGANCPKFRACHVNQARREAMAADVVVINHHLFFADLAVRESGMAELLPSVRVAIFDEAHQLNETGVQFLGTQLTTGQ
jgi:ATP-dependent DNA helicase DinG